MVDRQAKGLRDTLRSLPGAGNAARRKILILDDRLRKARFWDDGAINLPPGLEPPVQLIVKRFDATSDRESVRIDALLERTAREQRRKADAWTLWKQDHRPHHVTRDGAASLGLGLITDAGALRTIQALKGTAISTPYSNANCRLVVSNVTGVPAYTDTAIVNEIGRKAMDTSFPLEPGQSAGGATATARQFIWRGTFGQSDAVGDWRRFWATNVGSGNGDLWDDFASSQGTKPAATSIWELTTVYQFT